MIQWVVVAEMQWISVVHPENFLWTLLGSVSFQKQFRSQLIDAN